MRIKPLDDLTVDEEKLFNYELNDSLGYFLSAIPNVEIGDMTDGQFMKMRTQPRGEDFSVGELIFELQWLLHIYNTNNKKKRPELGDCKMIVSDLQITAKMREEGFCPRRGVMAKIKYEPLIKTKPVIMEIDWTKIKFISRPDEWFIEGAVCACEFDYGEPEENDKVEDNCGLFHGLTNETYNGYTGELPREDGETCTFDEFDIYLGDEKINEWTYKQLIEKLK